MTPKVSICIPVYNTDKYLRKTLESIVGQTYPYHEILISDNASTDNSLKIAEEFIGPKVKVLRNKTTIDGLSNYNKLIEAAEGDLIALFNSDDVYGPTIIEEEVAQFIAHPELGAVFTTADLIDENDEIIGEYFLDEKLARADTIDFDLGLASFIESGKCSFLFPSAMVPKKVYGIVGPFTWDFQYAQDHDMHYKILEKFPVKIIPKKLMKYRRHKDQSSNQKVKKGVVPNEIFKLFNKYLKSSALRSKINDKVLHHTKQAEKDDFYKCALNALNDNRSVDAKTYIYNAAAIFRNPFDALVKHAVDSGNFRLVHMLLGLIEKRL
jgi:glycosyltransferase involved in cell wall biosynthesis